MGKTVTVEAKGFGDPKSEMMKNVVDLLDRVVGDGVQDLDIGKVRQFLGLAYAAGHATGFVSALELVRKANDSVCNVILTTVNTFESVMDDMEAKLGGTDSGGDGGGTGIEGASRWIDRAEDDVRQAQSNRAGHVVGEEEVQPLS